MCNDIKIRPSIDGSLQVVFAPSSCSLNFEEPLRSPASRNRAMSRLLRALPLIFFYATAIDVDGELEKLQKVRTEGVRDLPQKHIDKSNVTQFLLNPVFGEIMKVVPSFTDFNLLNMLIVLDKAAKVEELPVEVQGIPRDCNWAGCSADFPVSGQDIQCTTERLSECGL